MLKPRVRPIPVWHGQTLHQSLLFTYQTSPNCTFPTVSLHLFVTVSRRTERRKTKEHCFRHWAPHDADTVMLAPHFFWSFADTLAENICFFSAMWTVTLWKIGPKTKSFFAVFVAGPHGAPPNKRGSQNAFAALRPANAVEATCSSVHAICGTDVALYCSEPSC